MVDDLAKKINRWKSELSTKLGDSSCHVDRLRVLIDYHPINFMLYNSLTYIGWNDYAYQTVRTYWYQCLLDNGIVYDNKDYSRMSPYDSQKILNK